MKTFRNSLLVLASILLFPLLASAQNGPYVLLGSGEVGQATVDGGPVQVTYDLTVTTSHDVSTATLSNIETNSNCGDDNSAMNGTATVSSSALTGLTFTADSSSGTSGMLKFSISSHGDVTLTSATGCALNSGSKITFTNQLQTVSNNGVPQTSGCFFIFFPVPCVYSGDLDGNNGTNNGDDTGIETNITFQISPSFSLDGTTVQVNGQVCSALPKGTPLNLTVTAAAATEAAIGTNNESGNVLIFAATDGTNLIGFIATPTGEDGNTERAGDWYITYYVEGGPCNGSNGGDSPFSLKNGESSHPAPPRRMPIRFGGLALRSR